MSYTLLYILRSAVQLTTCMSFTHHISRIAFIYLSYTALKRYPLSNLPTGSWDYKSLTTRLGRYAINNILPLCLSLQVPSMGLFCKFFNHILDYSTNNLLYTSYNHMLDKFIHLLGNRSTWWLNL